MVKYSQSVKNCLFLLACLLCFPSELKAADQMETPNEGFPERLTQAYERALSGGFGGAFATFEQLIESDPNVFITYDAYAQALEHKAMFYDKAPKSRETYGRAIAIYEKWLARDGAKDPADMALASERIKELKRKQEFTEVIAQAEPWEHAKIYGTVEFAIKSNLPKEYCLEVGAEVQKIIESEKEVLNRIFGYQAEEQAWVKLFIAGSWEDYKTIFQEFRPHRLIPQTAFYFHDERTIVILFDGSFNTKDLAHEVAHYLIQENYIKRPSRLLAEGMAEYVSYKLTKASAKAQVMRRLGRMDWLYEQGEWERPFPAESDRFKFLEAYYLRAWALIYFLIESGDDSFSQLFKKYLDYEKSRSDNNDATFRKFFEESLTRKELEDLNNKWQSFTLSLSYEKI